MLMDIAYPLLQLLYHITIFQYNLVGWIVGIARVITWLSYIMLLRKIKNYPYEYNTKIITFLVNIRKIRKFDWLWSFRTLWLPWQTLVYHQSILIKFRVVLCVCVFHSADFIFKEIFKKKISLLGKEGFS